VTRFEFISQFQHIRQPKIEPDFPLRKTGRPAAVLIPLVDYGDKLNVLLTERAHHLKHHPGQISFPGGAVDETDKGYFDAALREADEEIGLPPQNVDIVGMLPRYRTISGYEIAPVVGFVNPNFTPVIDKNEVESAFEVPLNHLLNRKNHLIHTTHRGNQSFPIYFIPYKERMIWGATAAMLRNLSHHIHP